LTEYKKLGSLIDEGELLPAYQITVKCLLILMYQSQSNYQTDIKNRADSKLVYCYKWSSIKIQRKRRGNCEFDSETGNIAFRSRFPNPDKLLKNGETGKVLMTVPLKMP
jgi:membrane fusion protein (multidrug efflux system)